MYEETQIKNNPMWNYALWFLLLALVSTLIWLGYRHERRPTPSRLTLRPDTRALFPEAEHGNETFMNHVFFLSGPREAPTAQKGLVDAILFINRARDTERRQQVVDEIERLHLNVPVFRFEAIEHNNGALGCFKSHVIALEWVMKHMKDKNVMILEDDVTFHQPAKLEEDLQRAHKVTHGRWDVIVLGQYVHKWQPIAERVYRLLHSTTTSGYMVHASYVRELTSRWFQALTDIIDRRIFTDEDHLDQIQTQFQSRGLWLGFKEALCSQRAAVSTIGNVMIQNYWRCNDQDTEWFDAGGTPHPLITRPTLKIYNVGICHVATGQYKQYVPRVQAALRARFLKPHRLHFFVFTDDPSGWANQSDIHVTTISRQGFPGDTLYRYHYMLKAEQQLQNMDYIYYTDVDYDIKLCVDPELFFPASGLVATAHLHNVTERPRVTERGKTHIGSPDTNTRSTACIHAHEALPTYFAGGVQGGKAADFLKACHVMRDRIDTDDRQGVMALWHDESHWNRYLLDFPPAQVLDQSYIFPEKCLNMKNTDHVCQVLWNLKKEPVMIPLEKNHAKVRA